MRIPISAQMFAKSNIKGLAVLLYPLLLHLLEAGILPKGQSHRLAQSMTMNWFPYGLAEMKGFKQACMNVADAIAANGALPGEADAEGQIKNSVLTKNVMESA